MSRFRDELDEAEFGDESTQFQRHSRSRQRGLMADLDPANDEPRRRAQEPVQSSQVGNVVQLLASEGRAAGLPSLVRHRLLKVADPLPGSWVLSINVRDLSTTTRNINDAIALLTVGVGANAQEVEITLSPNCTIQLPCESVSVDVYWDVLPASGGVITLSRPDLEITGLIRRGVSNAYAHRVFWLPYGTVLDSGPPGIVFPVPPFAKRFWSWGVDSDGTFGAGSTAFWDNDFNLIFDAATSGSIQNFPGPQRLSKANLGESFDVPGGATKWNATLGTGKSLQDRAHLVDFEIRL